SFLQGYKVKDLIMHDYNTLDINDPLSKAVEILLNGQGKDFLITEENKIAGTLNRTEMIKALSEQGKDTPITNLKDRHVIYIKPDLPLEEMYQSVQHGGMSLMSVI